MANFAYQVSGFAYQAAGQFAYQGTAGTTPVVTVTPTVSGVPGRSVSRRKYILPDETIVFATRQEIEEILERYSRPKVVKAKTKSKAIATVVESQLEFSRFEPALDAPQITVVKLPETLVFMPSGNDWKQLVATMRRRADEEFLLLW